ncbi:histidine phosphatase family protein, partial [Butyricicoccus sp. 1XD8-22]
MSKIEFYFVRHGETEWNKDGRLQGWLDSPLTNKGRESTRK